MAEKLDKKNGFSGTIKEIKTIIRKARFNAFNAVNTEMLKADYEIGRKIVEEEQKGKKRAGYGEKLIEIISVGLMNEFIKGFDVTTLRRMRRFYLTYQKWETVSPKLTGSHYCELIKIDEDLKRRYFEKYAITENLSVEMVDKVQIEYATAGISANFFVFRYKLY